LIRQYRAHRRRGGPNPLGVGVIPVGAIFYIQNDGWWRDRYRGAPVCRNPWIVEAFLNGTISAARRNRDTGLWEDVYAAGRSDMALVRSLRDGRRRQVAVRTLILHEEHGLSIGPCGYPDLPDMRLWRLSDPGAHSPNRTIRPHPLTTSAIPAAMFCPSAPIATPGKPDMGNGTRQKAMREGLGTKRLPHRRPPPQGTGLRPRAARALAPPDRDAPRGMGLPEEQGG
jgi:hypothetical protein